MLARNLAVLKSRFPVVLQRILQSSGDEPMHFKYVETNGKDVLHTKCGDHAFPTYGVGNKTALLDRWASNLRTKSESLYSLTGFGDGSHIKHFIENTSGGTNFLVTEKDPSLIRETLSRIDLSDVLSNDRLLLGAGECNDDFFKDLQGAAMLGLSDVNSVIFSPLHCVDEAYYDNARNEMVRQYLVIRPLMEVNLRTGTNLQENTFENMKHMANSPDVGELAGMFADTPFILIGAGPSLDESIDFLKEVQDRAIIVTSNSPYRKLINSGIRPHLAVTADPLSPTLAGFNNVSLDGVPLACPFSAYPEIVKRFSGRILSWVTFSPIVDVLKAAMGQKPGTAIMEQGTVSGCVLDLSRLFGCRKVLFIGQDMCVRSDGKYYTNDSAYSDSGSHYTSKMEGHRLPGNCEDEVIVEGRLYVYLKTFEKFISENPSVEYRNLAKTGVRVQGAPYLDYDDALQWIGSNTTSVPFDEKVHELLSQQGPVPELSDVFFKARKYVENLLQECLSLAIKTELLPAKFSGTNYERNKNVLDLLQSSEKVNKLVDSDQQLWNLLLDGKTKAELAVYKRIIRDINHPNANWSAIQKNKEYFWALSEGCHWLLNLMDQKISQPVIESTN
jgi:hypothetical protein